MGLLPATRGIGSTWTRWRLLKHLRPLDPAPMAWRLSQLAPHITKNDTAGEVRYKHNGGVVCLCKTGLSAGAFSPKMTSPAVSKMTMNPEVVLGFDALTTSTCYKPR